MPVSPNRPLSHARAQATVLTVATAGIDFTPAIRIGAVLFATVLTIAAAQVSITLPFTPVPLTLQPMVVLLTAAALGSRLAFASQVLYLMAGLAGMPVFSPSLLLPPGAGRLLGPTGGYLLAYPAAAFVTGWLAERRFDRQYLTSFLAMAIGLSVVFAGGVTWLAYGLPGVGFDAALHAGLYPFVLVDAFKLAVASAVLPALWRLIGETRRPTE